MPEQRTVMVNGKRIADLSGNRYNMLTAVLPVKSVAKPGSNGGGIVWLFACDCGQTKAIRAANVKNHGTVSCGCYRKARLQTHGMKSTPEYKAYSAAQSRCNNERTAHFNDYGGRGIRFKFTTFQEFYDDVGSRPTGMSLDRKDVNGHYEVGNVRWATQKEQVLNRRKYNAVENFSDDVLRAEVQRRGLWN